MKSRTLILILVFVLSVLITIGGCATKRKVISDEEFLEVWSGTWINTDYGGDTQAKIINYRLSAAFYREYVHIYRTLYRLEI